LTYYYNLVLSKLNTVPGVDLTVIVPSRVSEHIGDGVYQTKEGANFRIVELEEYKQFGLYTAFKGMVKILLKEKPVVIIAPEEYLYAFLLSTPLVILKRMLGFKIIMKSIPFQVPLYENARSEIMKINAQRNGGFVLRSVLSRLIRLLKLRLRRALFNLPEAHVNYIDDASEIYGSYGVAREKIFVTRNSPDTDILFSVRKSLELSSNMFQKNDHRIVHLSRLVAWKRVDLLIKAFARIKKSFTDADMLVIGNGPERESLERTSAELGVSKDVKFLGGVYDPYILGKHLMSSSVYVLAGMGGLSINEAMCFGLPVICSVCDGTEKILVRDGFNGKYFKDNDEDDLVEKIVYLFENPELRKSMGTNSTNIIRDEVNINTVINGYVRAFQYVTGEKN
jgi:glycosyltransferase involved in cell wall biosynthesis